MTLFTGKRESDVCQYQHRSASPQQNPKGLGAWQRQCSEYIQRNKHRDDETGGRKLQHIVSSPTHTHTHTFQTQSRSNFESTFQNVNWTSKSLMQPFLAKANLNKTFITTTRLSACSKELFSVSVAIFWRREEAAAAASHPEDILQCSSSESDSSNTCRLESTSVLWKSTGIYDHNQTYKWRIL